MGYIYKITNKINNKVYIGQTKRDIKVRFWQHKTDSNKKDFVLYKAMRKYGKDNFYIEIIEKCENDLLNRQEKYWISFYNSYNKGYNSTIGGETSSMVQAIKIKQYSLDGKYIKTYDSIKQATYELGGKSSSINFALKGKYKTALGFQWRYENDNRPITKEHYGRNKRVYQYDLNGNFIKEFLTIREAEKELNGNEKGTCILQCCKKKHKTAYGYQWSYENKINIGKIILLKYNQYVKLTAI